MKKISEITLFIFKCLLLFLFDMNMCAVLTTPYSLQTAETCLKKFPEGAEDEEDKSSVRVWRNFQPKSIHHARHLLCS